MTSYDLRIRYCSSVVCSSYLVALPTMRARGWGRIVNVASVTVYGGWALLSPYVASKGALVGLTRAWAREFGVDGITRKEESRVGKEGVRTWRYRWWANH